MRTRKVTGVLAARDRAGNPETDRRQQGYGDQGQYLLCRPDRKDSAHNRRHSVRHARKAGHPAGLPGGNQSGFPGTGMWI